jgi:NMD protein affecting ribosome stability and mRNA decay
VFTALLTTLLLALTPAGMPSGGQGHSYAQTRSPHGNLNLPCQNCHTSLGWKPIRAVPEFDHNRTSYPLRGMHQGVSCVGCHTKPVFSNVGTKCADCHADIHKRQLGANCESCHTVKGWMVSVKQIESHQNRFPLIGAHAAVECDACHKNAAVGQFTGLSTACYSCHANQFKQTTNPNHVATGFATNCERCHGMNNWFSVNFDHAATGFPLTGAHTTVPCTQCHVNGNFNLTSANTACSSCHLKDFQSTNNPNHVTAGFSQSCQNCHNTTAWQPAQFDHSKSGFPLTGAHATTPCAKCHVNNNFNLTNRQCASCHIPDYNATNNPPHAAAGFPTDCSVCHGTSSWLGASFNHASTGWPLTGFHATVRCTQCHVNNNYKLTSTLCVSCHLKDFQTAKSPDHVASGLPQQCDVCHNTTAWIPSSFNHNNTPFPLTGFHTKVPCAQCHVNNNYTSLPTDCYSCHKADYTATNNPNHTSAGFPTTCATCHNTTSWLGATFNHTWFPTNHGGANGVCSTCHTNPSNYLVFQCTNCHQKSQTDSNHRGVSGYVYNSTNCYNCHRNGGGG